MIARRAAVVAVAVAVLALAAVRERLDREPQMRRQRPAQPRQRRHRALRRQARSRRERSNGVVRDDSNKPVAGPVTVTLSSWVPKGGYYSIEEFKTLTVDANAAGKFSYAAMTATKLSIAFEAAGASAQADVSRELQVRREEARRRQGQGHGQGRGKAPLTFTWSTTAATRCPGRKAGGPSKTGSAVFNLGSFHGKFTYAVEAGEYDDLFWEGRKPTFRHLSAEPDRADAGAGGQQRQHHQHPPR